MKRILSLLTIVFILLSVCVPVFAETFTYNGTTYEYERTNEGGMRPLTQSEKQTFGLSGNVYMDPDDYNEVKSAVAERESSNLSLGIDADTQDYYERGRSDLDNVSRIVGNFAPDFNTGSEILGMFSQPITAVLGLVYIVGMIIFMVIEGYNFYLIIFDSAYESTGAGATSTEGGAVNGIIALLNRCITNNTKKCLQQDSGRFSKWIPGEIVKLIALGVMIILFWNGLAFKLIGTLGSAAMKMFGFGA